MNNQIKTVMLLGLLTGILLWMGQFFGGPTGLTVMFIVVLLMNFVMYWFSDKIVLWMYRAKEVEKNSSLYHLVKEVADLAKLPMPRVYIIPSKNPNAFATGRSPKNSAVACTEGILDLLKKHELKGVIAHELGHIKNRDTLITTIAATLAGVIAYMASMMRWAAFFGMGDRDRDGKGILELIALAIVTPLIATLLQLAISRSREYLADETAAKITKDPYSLADALEKISAGVKMHPMGMGSEATSALFIANPFKGGILNWFSTHPPMDERVKRLKAMKIRSGA
ncbi:MAG: zinc metalloprotease HtpX [Candidatus Woesearchaeota archaeon]|nr:zinc metalloprotease HtpX [Candidatus Woesearchaeota archaeon]